MLVKEHTSTVKRYFRRKGSWLAFIDPWEYLVLGASNHAAVKRIGVVAE